MSIRVLCLVVLVITACSELRKVLFLGHQSVLFMAALWNRAGHYIFILSFLLSSPRLISAVTDRMSTILPHMVWP